MKALVLYFPVLSMDMRFGHKWTKITNLTIVKMWQWHYSNKNKSLLKHFKCDFLNCFCIRLTFSFAHMKAENLLKTPNQMSFWAVSISEILSSFLAYLKQFQSKSHLQGHLRKVESKSFHLTPILRQFQALLFEIFPL